MEQSSLAELTNEQLLNEAKKIKKTNLYDRIFIGVLIGIAIYSTINHGLGLLTFLPLVYVPIAAKNSVKNKELEKLLKEKNLR